MEDVFNLFQQVPYTFLQISRGGVLGDGIVDEVEAYGVFKLREGLLNDGYAETANSTATLHIKPSEEFITTLASNLVGHGVRVDNISYSIEGQTGGYNFDLGVMEHYRVTLQRSEFEDLQNAS